MTGKLLKCFHHFEHGMHSVYLQETVLNKSGQHAGTDEPLMSYMLAIWQLRATFAMWNIHKYCLSCFEMIVNYQLTFHYNTGLSNVNMACCASSPHQGQTDIISLCCMK